MNSEQNKKTKFLGETKISKLIMTQSIPAILGMSIMSLYMIIDSIFIGQIVGPLGIAALAITMPIMVFIMAIAQMIGNGFSTLISKSLGENNKDKSEKLFSGYFFIIILISLFFSILGLIFTEQLFKLFGSNKIIMPYALEYGKIMFYGLFFFMFVSSSNNILRSQGQAKMAMFSMMIGAILNIILDYILIYLFKYGMFGASLATAISQFFSTIIILYYFNSNRNPINFNIKYLIPSFKLFKQILALGSPSFIRQSGSSIISLIVNNLLIIYSGPMGLAAFSIINRLKMFLVMPIFGLVQGIQPIIGYNYGAKKYIRVKQTLKKAILYIIIGILIPYLIIMLFPGLFIKLFTSDQNLINLAIPYLRIIFLLLPLSGVYMIIGGFFQSLGKAKISLYISLIRQVLILIPLIYIMSYFFELKGLLISFPISEFLTFVSVYLIYKINITSIYK